MEKFLSVLISIFMTVSLAGEPMTDFTQEPAVTAYEESAFDFA